MELKEISATAKSPYRCYVRGSVLQSEGDNVYTVGFKDGLAVVQVINADMERKDNSIIDKAIDLTKLKKIIVKADPQTGKKYIVREGRKIELFQQVQNSSATKQPDVKVKRNFIIKTAPNLGTALGKILSGGALFPNIAPKQAVVLNKQTSSSMKVVDGGNFKYQVLSLSVKKQGEKAEVDLKLSSDKGLQTDSVERKDSSTQTETGRDSPFTESFFKFILDGDNDSEVFNRKMIDPGKLRTKEEMSKFNFFNDMRNALNFDRSGNLPIHESVMQNKLKAVQKHCIVLRAIRENVNIANQQGFTPLHLAVLHDVSIEIINILLVYGADLSVADPEGNTAIHLAIENGRSDVLKFLLDWARQTRFSLDVFNYEGFTPLILAVLNRSYTDAKLLLQHGADPNVKDMKSGRTALFHAAECFDGNLVELLMEYKADTKIRNFFGTSAHDAMFEVEDMPLKIKFSILGRDHQRFQNKKKPETRNVDKLEQTPVKKAKLETTPILRKVDTNDMHLMKKRK